MGRMVVVGKVQRTHRSATIIFVIVTGCFTLIRTYRILTTIATTIVFMMLLSLIEDDTENRKDNQCRSTPGECDE